MSTHMKLTALCCFAIALLGCSNSGSRYAGRWEYHPPAEQLELLGSYTGGMSIELRNDGSATMWGIKGRWVETHSSIALTPEDQPLIMKGWFGETWQLEKLEEDLVLHMNADRFAPPTTLRYSKAPD